MPDKNVVTHTGNVPTEFVKEGGKYTPIVYTRTLDESGGSSSNSALDRELVVMTYRCKIAFSGAAVGDTITATQILDLSSAVPSTVSTIWMNQSSMTDLATAPSAGNLELVGSSGITDAQMAARGYATADKQPALDVDGGAKAHVTNFPKIQPVSGTVTAISSLAASWSHIAGTLSTTLTQLSSNVAANNGVTLIAPNTNTGVLYLSNSATDSSNILTIPPGGSITLPINNSNLVWVKGENTTDKYQAVVL